MFSHYAILIIKIEVRAIKGLTCQKTLHLIFIQINFAEITVTLIIINIIRAIFAVGFFHNRTYCVVVLSDEVLSDDVDGVGSVEVGGSVEEAASLEDGVSLEDGNSLEEPASPEDPTSLEEA